MRPRGVRVSPRNLDQIRATALAARRVLRITKVRIDMIDLLENRLRSIGIHYHLVDTSRIPGDAARAIPEEGKLLLTADAYNAIHDKDPNHQLLVPHELGHFALRHSATFSRVISQELHMGLEDSEVQADLFSHEFTMPIEAVQEFCNSIEMIQKVFNVPAKDAKIRADKFRVEGLVDW
jgi:hypothetical protein